MRLRCAYESAATTASSSCRCVFSVNRKIAIQAFLLRYPGGRLKKESTNVLAELVGSAKELQ